MAWGVRGLADHGSGEVDLVEVVELAGEEHQGEAL
jgi:hypothetical protein